MRSNTFSANEKNANTSFSVVESSFEPAFEMSFGSVTYENVKDKDKEVKPSYIAEKTTNNRMPFQEAETMELNSQPEVDAEGFSVIPDSLIRKASTVDSDSGS